MIDKLKVHFLGANWDCIDDFPLNEKVDVVVRPEDIIIKKPEEGKVKAIGVSNFTPARFTNLALNSKITPMVNQIEVNPFYQQDGIEEFYKKFDTKVEAWGPLAEGRNNIFKNPLLSKIAENHDKSVAQIILRWLTQRGIIVFPKSVNVERIEENFNIFDFELTDGEMKEIKSLQTNEPIANIDTPEFVEMISNFKYLYLYKSNS